MKALRRCTQLKCLALVNGSNTGGSIPVLMDNLPKDFRQLYLCFSMLQDEDVKCIAEAVKEHKLEQLELLGLLECDLITEAAVIFVIKAFIAVRPEKQLIIVVSFPCSAEMEALCKHTNITVLPLACLVSYLKDCKKTGQTIVGKCS